MLRYVDKVEFHPILSPKSISCKTYESLLAQGALAFHYSPWSCLLQTQREEKCDKTLWDTITILQKTLDYYHISQHPITFGMLVFKVLRLKYFFEMKAYLSDYTAQCVKRAGENRRNPFQLQWVNWWILSSSMGPIQLQQQSPMLVKSDHSRHLE